MSSFSVEIGDLRRACAAQLHYANTNLEGIAAVLFEATETDRTLPLVWAMLQLNHTLLAATYESGGAQTVLNDFILNLAAEESR